MTRRICSLLTLIAFIVTTVRCNGCTFPADLDGVFESSHETDPLTFNTTHVYPFSLDTQSLQFTNLVFECNFANGSYYIARSTEAFDIYTVLYHVYTCWEFSKQSSNNYVVYQATTKLASAQDKNYKIYPENYPVTSDMICDVPTPYTGDTVSLLVKNGTASSAKATCPQALWGKYVYQLTDTSGTTYCDYSSWLDVCTSTDTLSVNTTTCSDTTLYSSGGTLYCMFNMADSSASDTYYVYLYNDDATVDNSATYRFTCIVMHYSSNETRLTQYPNECLASAEQNATYMTTSPGGLYTMYANVTCPPTTASSTDYTIIIVAVVVVLLVLIIIGVIAGVYYYKRVYLPKRRAMSSKVSPDGIPESAMTWDKNYRMMFTPGPPKSAVPPREPRRAGQGNATMGDGQSRPMSGVTIGPTVSALAGYRTPSPFISDYKDVDSDSLLDYDFGPKKGEPDGEESGVDMMEVETQGSLPVYSEAGDTPEPTRRTPLGGERY